MVAAQWVDAGLLVGGDGHEASPFVRAAVHAAKTSLVRASRLLVCPTASAPPCSGSCDGMGLRVQGEVCSTALSACAVHIMSTLRQSLTSTSASATVLGCSCHHTTVTPHSLTRHTRLGSALRCAGCSCQHTTLLHIRDAPSTPSRRRSCCPTRCRSCGSTCRTRLRTPSRRPRPPRSSPTTSGRSRMPCWPPTTAARWRRPPGRAPPPSRSVLCAALPSTRRSLCCGPVLRFGGRRGLMPGITRTPVWYRCQLCPAACQHLAIGEACVGRQSVLQQSDDVCRSGSRSSVRTRSGRASVSSCQRASA